ncbi:diphthine--ammonia ligase [Algivirga pacifica]|uniref:Diphthine--ammonia ligase n=1 Tax=Algivirga pacifica TaxID=1162670 RepID=A0ABP9DF53_9BACT
MKQALFNWSGGKDSTLALHHILKEQQYDVKTLMTSINTAYDRISMHGVRKELLHEQASAIGLPIRELLLPESPSMEDYNRIMESMMQEIKAEGITHSIFGDIFLEDLKQYREERLQEVGLKGVFPLWKRDTKELIREFIDLGYKTVIVCCDAQLLGRNFAGRVIDEQLLSELPDQVDPCGENGEFHTFVFDGPIFKQPVSFKVGETILREYDTPNSPDQKSGFYFCDLIPV